MASPDRPGKARRPAPSLRRRLLAWILLPLTLLIGVNAWVAYGNAVHATNLAYDRSLYLAARTLAQELQWQEGQLSVDVVGAAGYLLENHTDSRLFYKITTPSGHWLAGDPQVPTLWQERPAEVRFFALVRFEDGLFQGQPVRLAELTHVLEQARPAEAVLKITVAETMEARRQLIQQILRDTLLSQGLLLVAAALLVVLGVQRGMRPLEAFRRQLADKDEDDFTAIEPPGVPRELQPLVQALNGHLRRLARLIDIRKRFLDNASHQLRTPLTALKTQLTLAGRQPLDSHTAELVQAASRTTDTAVRLSEQLLAMTRAEHARDMQALEQVDLVALAREVTDEHLLRAHHRGDDLGLEVLVPHLTVSGVRTLLREALVNLVDNALHHSEAGTRVTVRVGPHWVEVEDDGPGIAPQHQPHVFERFYRAAPSHRSGSGLGLAIVREISLQHGMKVQLTSPVASGRGSTIRMGWPPPQDR